METKLIEAVRNTIIDYWYKKLYLSIVSIPCEIDTYTDTGELTNHKSVKVYILG